MFDSIKFAIENLTIIISCLFMLFLIYKCIKYFQDTRYNVTDSLLYIWFFYRKHYYLLLLIPFIFLLYLWYFQLIFSLLVIVIYLTMRKREQISKLRFTPRVIRIYGFMVIAWTALGTLLMMIIDFPQLTSLLGLFIVITPPLAILSGIAITPVELLISKGYQLKAKKKLKEHYPYVIGITGSCGKTSVKNYTYELLKEKHITFQSPKSFNTLNGISITINNYLNFKNVYLILEMGATKLGDIEKLVRFTHPHYGIVTEIVPQHFITFKNIENIINEKMKLVESLPSDGIAFLNYNNKYIRNYKIKNNCRVIKFGTTEDCDYYATDINMTLKGISFIVNFNNKELNIETSLLGSHNITNLVAAIALAIELGINENEVIDAIYRIKPVPHRLQIRTDHNLTIIDDAYNSNVQGFKNALQVLDLARGYRTLITPGIVDMGDETESINYNLSKSIYKICDEVILIDNRASRHIAKGLAELGFKNVKIVGSFKDGFALVEKGTVLIENDLTDNYFL